MINETTPAFMQDVVDVVVKHHRSVSFSCSVSNDELRNMMAYVDMKGCKFHKPEPDSTTVSVWPGDLIDFIFG
jgi:hypothetical protein